MILESLSKHGCDSEILIIKEKKEDESSVTLVVAPGQRVKVPDKFKYDKGHFKEIEKEPRKRYDVEVNGTTKIRKSLISIE